MSVAVMTSGLPAEVELADTTMRSPDAHDLAGDQGDSLSEQQEQEQDDRVSTVQPERKFEQFAPPMMSSDDSDDEPEEIETSLNVLAPAKLPEVQTEEQVQADETNGEEAVNAPTEVEGKEKGEGETENAEGSPGQKQKQRKLTEREQELLAKKEKQLLMQEHARLIREQEALKYVVCPLIFMCK